MERRAIRLDPDQPKISCTPFRPPSLAPTPQTWPAPPPAKIGTLVRPSPSPGNFTFSRPTGF